MNVPSTTNARSREDTVELPNITVLRPGSEVYLDGMVKAFISSVKIDAELSVTYYCNWWNGNDYKGSDFYPSELTQIKTKPNFKIGFLPTEKSE